jgi:2-polyprenyl-6-methoxyphenol hydroxylase-like FAD-dependent oxidoreductase
MKIIIIGGGIGGLGVALALRQAGFEPEVFEQAPALLEVGAAIAVWPNAMRVLERLGVSQGVLEKAGLIKEARWLNSDGRVLGQVRFPETDAPAVALHRADLQHILLQASPAENIHLGKRFESYRQQGGDLHASFDDGSSFGCHLLIAADGLHSRCRAQMLNDGPPVYRGYTVWRGVAAHTPGTLPPFTAMEIYGRGQRFGIGPVGLGRTGWWATANEPESGAETASERQGKLLSLCDGWYAPVLELIEATPTESILRNAAYDRPPIKKWHEGNMILLGDAAHPTTPNLGQGGCMALEDAVLLSRCLMKYRDQGYALRTYEALRYARTAAITRYSLRYGAIGQWGNSSAARLRNALLSLIPETLGQRSLKLIFDYDAYGVNM